MFDGHGGSKCAEYLKENLHNNIILQPDFPKDITAAIKKGCVKTENDFLSFAYQGPSKQHNKAGSCAIVVFVVDNDVYICNVGDSRAIASISKFPDA